MIMHKPLNPVVAKMERNAFYNASLRLVKDGKFQAMSVAEIAFMARISEGTIPFIFESREQLVTNLIEHVTGQITETIVDALKKSDLFEDRFYNVWHGLFDFYSSNPNVIAFIEQFENLNKERKFPAFVEVLVELFRKAHLRGLLKPLNPETLAYLFHENILTAAKMKSSGLFTNLNYDPQQVPVLFWSSISAGSINN